MASKIDRVMTTEGMLALLGYVISLRTIAFGSSFLFETVDAQRTVLFQSIHTLPVLEPATFGLIMVISGLLAFIGYLLRTSHVSKHLVKYSSYIQFIAYLFTAGLYIAVGSFEYALSAALPWVFLVYIISYAYYRVKSSETLADLVRREIKRSRD